MILLNRGVNNYMAKTTKKKTGSKKKQQKPEVSQNWSVAFFGVSALLFALTFIEGESIWSTIRIYGLFGTFGLTTYLVAPIVLYFAVLIALGKPVKVKALQATFLLILISACIQVFGVGYATGNTFIEGVQSLYSLGCNEVGGGAIGALLGWTLLHYFGTPAAHVTLLIIGVVCLMLFTGITPVDVFGFLGEQASTVKEKADEYIALREEEKALRAEEYEDEEYEEEPVINRQAYDIAKEKRETSKNNIDISLDDEPKKKKGFFGFGKKSDIDIDLGPSTTGMTQEPSPDPDKINLNLQSGTNNAQQYSPNASQEGFGGAENLQTASNTDGNIDALAAKALAEQKRVEEENYLAQGQGETRQVKHSLEKRAYKYPKITLFDETEITDDRGASAELKKNAELLVSTLESFGVHTKVLDISRGPSVTRYELQPQAGVKISKITSLSDDIALALATAGVRIEAPIPNKAAVGIEVPNKHGSTVNIRSVLESNEYKKAKSKLVLPLGKDIAGAVQVADLTRMPHILIAGSTGSGKSVCINGIITSILYNASPEEVRMILIDPKVVELSGYNGVPHLLMPVVSEPSKAAGALAWAVTEMEVRYRDFADNGVRDIASFNKVAEAYGSDLEVKPYIAIVIDELADLMMAAGKKVEDYICRLAQKARAAGIHLIIATQRPSVDVITGLIKANIPSRVAFAVSSQVDSRTILDGGGAEKLLGMGDMLFWPVGAPKPVRVQGAYVKDDEINRVIEAVKENAPADYSEEIMEKVDQLSAEDNKTGAGGGFDSDHSDPVLEQAIEIVVDAKQASTSLLQRRLRLGYARAARVMDEMEQMGIIGPSEGSKPRQVLMTREQWLERSMNIE